jgi:hypothetical protein
VAINALETLTVNGLAELAAAWRGAMGPYDAYRVEAEESRQLDNEDVSVLVDQVGRGKASGIPMSRNGAKVFSIRSGNVVRLVLNADRDRALANLGLTE